MSRILLLHPLDRPSHFIARSKWDLIVDLGRVPASTYEAWSRTAGCRILSLYDFNEGTRDLQRMRELLAFGMGEVVDEFGLDWWDVLAQSAVPALQQLILARRLADMVGPTAEIHSTRPHFVATALGHLTGRTLVELQSGRSLFGRAKHYVNAFQQLDFRQFTQVLQDKFDPEHNIRRRFNRRKQRLDSFILLPSAYVNVSRTAVGYADMVPDASFLLVTGRNSGRLPTLPANVQMESLDGYFSGTDRREMNSLVERWSRLELKLSESAKELAAANASGVLTNAKALLRWGVAVRNGWLAVFESQNISSCLCADDSNPYSRIPLILAGKRGIPALTCHHGALDSRVAIKTQHADLYLAKGEMESDYLTRVCQLAPERIVLSAPVSSPAIRPPGSANVLPNWLVFFTEPYQAMGWRTEDIYAELLPRLLLLEEQCKLELVFKLHPFESMKGHRRLLRRFFTPAKTRQVRIIAGLTIPEFWSRVGCALTVQSTVALDCAERNIPIFLCGWLADSLSGYAQQYARFGIGHLLESPQQMALVPELIAKAEDPRSPITRPINASETLRRVLSGTYSRAAVLSA